MSGTKVRAIDDHNFEAEVLRSPEPFLLEFGATWCGPCKAMAPVVEALAAETDGKARVGAIDMDDAPETAKRFGVRGVPTVLVFKDGQLAARHTGATTHAKLRALLGV